MEKNYDARNIALNVLCRILEEKVPSHTAIAEGLAGNTFLKEDRSFIKKLVIGTIERSITIDIIIDRYSTVKVKKQKPVVRNVLRMGIYQILFMDVPDSAACNESVKLIKKRRLMGLSGFVNGVLRKTAAEKESIIKQINGKIRLSDEILSPEKEHSADKVQTDEKVQFREKMLSSEKVLFPEKEQSHEKAQSPGYNEFVFKYSMPEWIVKHYIERFGPQKAERAFEYFLSDSSVQIRCNISRISPSELVGRLKEENVTVDQRTQSDKCMIISGFDKLESLKAFREGLFAVQDYSSVLASDCPDSDLIAEYIKKSGRSALEVLDICAAPGGKTMNMADRLIAEGVEASFTACDVSESKLNKIRENIERCGFDNIKPIINDATVCNPSFIARFDIVIADVPCSGLGVICRKPDIKLNSSPEKIEELSKLQRSILINTVKYVKTNGFMTFSTCTTCNAENDDNTEFIKSMGFEELDRVQICPGDCDCDGFYYAVLRKL